MKGAATLKKGELSALFAAARAHGYPRVEVAFERPDGHCMRIVARGDEEADTPDETTQSAYDSWKSGG